MNQETRILDYMLENGSITALEAMREFGIMRLASRISDLKNRPDLKAKGYVFTKEMEKSTNRYGEKVAYARYRLEVKP